MIYIKEASTKKVPGITSLFVEFKYHPAIIDVVKQCTGAYYSKKDQIWEVPILNLSFLLDHLSLVDDIELTLLKDKSKPIIHYKQNPTDSIQLMNHQKEAVEFGLNNPKWLLLDAPGLGKTFALIKLAEELKRTQGIQHCLIVCGINTLKANWKKEIAKFSDLDSIVIGEHISASGRVYAKPVAARIEQLKNPIKEFFVITNVETLRDDKIIKAINKGKNSFDMIVVDEIHTMKSPSSQQGANLLKLKSTYQVGATGTLLLNDPLDTYMPLKWIGAEKSAFTNFKYYYCEYGGAFNNMLVGFKNTTQLKDQIEKYSLRRTKDLLNLPPKTVIDEYVEMDSRQYNFYNNIKDGIVDQVDKVKMSTANLLAMVVRLRQASELPQLLTSEKIESAKIERCIDLAEQILSDPNEKLVIFSCFKEPCNVVYNRLRQFNPLLCTGDVSDAEISESIDKFQKDDIHRVMVCTGSKMGTGVTLNRAHYAIFLSTPWNQGNQIQWEDRIHRIGTKDPVFIYRLWTIGTIDERVQELLQMKGALSDYVIDDSIPQDAIMILRKYIEELR